MSFETKEIYVGSVDKKEEEIKLRQNFGWLFVEDRHHGRSGGLHILLQRNIEMPYYDRLRTLESQYDALKKDLKYYSPITDSPECFLLIIMLVFPFVIYCAIKGHQKRKIAEHNAMNYEQMDELLKEAHLIVFGN